MNAISKSEIVLEANKDETLSLIRYHTENVFDCVIIKNINAHRKQEINLHFFDWMPWRMFLLL